MAFSLLKLSCALEERAALSLGSSLSSTNSQNGWQDSPSIDILKLLLTWTLMDLLGDQGAAEIALLFRFGKYNENKLKLAFLIDCYDCGTTKGDRMVSKLHTIQDIKGFI